MQIFVPDSDFSSRNSRCGFQKYTTVSSQIKPHRSISGKKNFKARGRDLLATPFHCGFYLPYIRIVQKSLAKLVDNLSRANWKLVLNIQKKLGKMLSKKLFPLNLLLTMINIAPNMFYSLVWITSSHGLDIFGPTYKYKNRGSTLLRYSDAKDWCSSWKHRSCMKRQLKETHNMHSMYTNRSISHKHTVNVHIHRVWNTIGT